MGADGQALAVVRGYHRAWTSLDFEEARTYLSDNLETDVPINTYRSTTEWMAAVERTRRMTSNIDVLSELGNDSEAVLLYDMSLPQPIGNLRVAELFAVRDGRIRRIRHVHDTYALRAAAASHPAQGRMQ